MGTGRLQGRRRRQSSAVIPPTGCGMHQAAAARVAVHAVHCASQGQAASAAPTLAWRHRRRRPEPRRAGRSPAGCTIRDACRRRNVVGWRRGRLAGVAAEGRGQGGPTHLRCSSRPASSLAVMDAAMLAMSMTFSGLCEPLLVSHARRWPARREESPNALQLAACSICIICKSCWQRQSQ